MIDSLTIAANAFLLHMLTSLSVDEIVLSWYVKISINFIGLPFNMEIIQIPTHLLNCLITTASELRE